MRWRISAVLAVFVMLAASDSYGQSEHEGGHRHDGTIHPGDSVVSAFMERARKATKKYHDLDTAVAAGYRLVGPDFPGMGEHWVNIRRVVQRDLEVERPAVLSYLRIDDKPILTGVAYAQPVRPGEDPPDFDVPGLWHFHSGTIDEETLLLNPRSMHHGSEDQPRLAMLHAWIWVDNPEGMFSQDNWALPFLRLGLPVPDAIPPQAGKALYLLTDGVGYYAQLVEVAGNPDDADKAAVQAALTGSYRKVMSRYEAMTAASVVTDSDLEWLAESWFDLWSQIERTVTPQLWERIKMLSG